MPKKKSGVVLETLRTVIYAVLIAMVVRIFIYEPFNIPSGSMRPTLLVGDYLFVSKFSYGFSRYSLPLDVSLIKGRIFAREPERGDVVVFKLPSDNRTDFIKRIVGLPGDTIQVKRGILHINGQPVKREKVGEHSVPAFAGFGATVTEYIETLPNGRTHRMWEMSDGDMLDNTPVFTVPPGHYFAMGDNRDSSQDSRVMSLVGFIPFENLIGRAEFMFFSHNESASLFKPWTWPGAIRFSRILDGIE
ncbi:MAG: signal peptidase I [Kiloniellaceae bacterium]